jgi:hypothetical protein
MSSSSTSSLDSFGSNESWRKQQQQQLGTAGRKFNDITNPSSTHLQNQRPSNPYTQISSGLAAQTATTATAAATKSVKFKFDNMIRETADPVTANMDDDNNSYTSHNDQSPPPASALIEHVTSAISKRRLKVVDVKSYDDGHVDKWLEDGTTVTMFPNGTVKEVSPSRQHIYVTFFNGDFKELDHATSTETYFYAETNITQVIDLKSGLQMLKFPNGQVEKFHADKTREIVFPDKIVKVIRPDGSEESRLPNGTCVRVEANGDKVIEYPNRQREVHTKEFKRREYPDGSVKTVFTNGYSETKYCNGRVRLKDNLGNLISDTKAAS